MLRRSLVAHGAAARPKTADCVIIGAGIIGCCVALEMARADPARRIVVVDSNTGAGGGTTSYSSGIIRAFYSVEETVRVSWECYRVWENWRDYLASDDPRGMASMRKTPGFILRGASTNSFLDGFVSQARKYSIPVEEWDVDKTRAKTDQIGWDITKCYEPRLIDDPKFGVPTGGRCTGSVWIPETGYVADPQLATKNAQHAATRVPNGHVSFVFGSRVAAIDQAAGAVTGVTLDDGAHISCAHVVNCAGPYSSQVTRMAFPKATAGVSTPANDMTVTTKPLRAECVVLPAPPGVDFVKNGVISFDLDTGIYIRPDFGSGGMLVGGLDLPCDPLEYVDVDHLQKQMDEGRFNNLGEQATTHLYRLCLRAPTVKLPSQQQLKGVVSTYDVSEDWTPIVDGSALRGYYMAIGTSGNCFKIGPLIGKIMAAVVNGDKKIQLSLTQQGTFDGKVFARNRAHLEFLGGVIG